MIEARLAWLRDEPGLPLETWVEQLDEAERAEFRRLSHPSRQRDYLLSRRLLRDVLSSVPSLTGSPPQFARAPSGRLLLATPSDWHISLSHGHGYIAVMAATAVCGVDIEVPRAVAYQRVAARYFAPSERAHLAALPPDLARRDFFRLWTLKEAGVKALGQGLAHNLERLAFALDLPAPTPADGSLGLRVWQTPADFAWLSAAVVTNDDVRWTCNEVDLATLLRNSDA